LPAFFVFMGIVFVGFALSEGKSFTSFPVVMGLGFAFFGVIFFVRTKKIHSPKKGNK